MCKRIDVELKIGDEKAGKEGESKPAKTTPAFSPPAVVKASRTYEFKGAWVRQTPTKNARTDGKVEKPKSEIELTCSVSTLSLGELIRGVLGLFTDSPVVFSSPWNVLDDISLGHPARSAQTRIRPRWVR